MASVREAIPPSSPEDIHADGSGHGLWQQRDILFPLTGIDCMIVPRKEAGGKAISASTVRKALQSGDWAALETLLPQTTLDYFRSEEAEPVLQRIRNAANVVPR